jgi:hypothetical protein
VNWYYSPHLVPYAQLPANVDGGSIRLSPKGLLFASTVGNRLVDFKTRVDPIRDSPLIQTGSDTGLIVLPDGDRHLAFEWVGESQMIMSVTGLGYVYTRDLLSTRQVNNTLVHSLWKVVGPDEIGPHDKWIHPEPNATGDCVGFPGGVFVCSLTVSPIKSWWWWFRVRAYTSDRFQQWTSEGENVDYTYTRYPYEVPFGVRPGSLVRKNHVLYFIPVQRDSIVYAELDSVSYTFPTNVSHLFHDSNAGFDVGPHPLEIINSRWFSHPAEESILSQYAFSLSASGMAGVMSTPDGQDPALAFDSVSVLSTSFSNDTGLDFDFTPHGKMLVMDRSHNLTTYQHIRPCPPHSRTSTTNAHSIQDCFCDQDYYKEVDTCQECKICGPGLLESHACNLTHNTVCRPCRETCAMGEWISKECDVQMGTDTECSLCIDQGCPDEHFLEGGCSGTERNGHLQCRPCQSCPEDHYIVGYSGCDKFGSKNTSDCEECGANCGSGTHRTNRCPGTTKYDTETCETCAACKVGEYRDTGCDGTTLSPAFTCATCDSCGNGTYIDSFNGCLGFSNFPVQYECETCVGLCEAGFLPIPACSGASWGTPTCVDCNSIACNPGTYIDASTPGQYSTKKKRVCIVTFKNRLYLLILNPRYMHLCAMQASRGLCTGGVGQHAGVRWHGTG